MALALAGLFYTVIPLYQKAAVDEQLARRETELKGIEANLQRARTEAYRLRRDDVMRVTSRRAGEGCADTRNTVMHRPEPDEPREQYHNRLVALDINIESCVAQYLKDLVAAKTLTNEDVASLEAWSKSLVTELEGSRQQVIRAISELPEAGKMDPSRLDAVGAFVAKTDELVDRYRAPLSAELRARQTEDRFNYRVQITQERLAMDYRLNVFRRLVNELEPKEWRIERANRAAPQATAS
ncbi:hypothetical protein AB6Q13_00705 [Ralstonia solanacearum]|uniref:hypothetical protein n=1 Tax=Ralstonia solanacearum TaxID=305 RepID=UPI0023052DCB|nr:hypothetical protein [Ralstonia solanacearum]MDB0564801.1 hypothetical protein [Ralstonia solanacearum]MDB0575490.1 hypothetical protein [Ralstonia solanacearum]